MATSSVSIKLLIDTKSRKVLFAEAGKDFVDLLFNILALPIGTVIRLLTKDSTVGSLDNLYGSRNCESYLIHKNQTKEALLRPMPQSSSLSQVPLLPDHASASRDFYCCSHSRHHNYVVDDPEALCPCCKCRMSQKMTYMAPSKTHVATSGNNKNEGEQGFVKGVVTYMVMDDLVVKPMSAISSIAMLKSFNIKEIDALQEKVVHLDMARGVKLLKASSQSKTVLTNVFLRGFIADS